MNYLTVLQKKIIQAFSLLFLGLLTTTPLLGQTITHDISTGSLAIPGTSTSSYIITGTANNNTVVIGSGYQGTITLRNLSITSTLSSPYNGASCITVVGQDNCSNLSPVTKVNFVLEGTNTLKYRASFGCGLQVNQGAQIHISAIDPNDNTSGKLFASASDYENAVFGSPGCCYAGAGIGAPSSSIAQGTGTISCGGSTSSAGTAGGNIIIHSGTIYAHGGHGAGIGGGYQTYYDGIIIITGGDVESYAQAHAAGIGSGCPTGSGVTHCHGANSAIVVLPPAEITAAGGPNRSPYHFMYDPDYALAGAENITYINDPSKSLITVRTIDNEPNANIYLDLTETTGLLALFTTLDINYDLTKVRVGRTDASGVFTFNAELQQNTTFYTDASSSTPATHGRPYLPVTTIVTTPTTVVLPLLSTNISFTDYPSTPLEVGYTVGQAGTNAHRIKVEYSDATPMTDVTFELQSGVASDFDQLRFFDADGVTPIPAPATFSSGLVFYIAFPIKQGKPIGVYTDVMLIDGVYGGTALPGYIRRIGQQRVVINDSPTNTYIKVTASPNKFIAAYPTTNSVTLTLNIDHTGTSVLYDQLDVTAKYLVTTIADYDAALLASPLTSSDWASMNIPVANNTNTTTVVPFSGKAEGTYYIHWYVESGVVYAHSLTVTDPPRTYGGFGPYILLVPEVTLSLDKTSIDEGGGAANGTAILTATLGGTTLAPAGGITVNLTYSGTATQGTDYTAPVSIIIPASTNIGTISLVALADYVLEGNETVSLTAPASVTAGGIAYSIIGSPKSITIVDKTDGTVSVSWARDAAEPTTKGQATFKFPGTGATAVSCTRNVKVEFSYSGVSATNNYTPNSPAEIIIPAGQNSATVDVVTPINNQVVEGTRQVNITLTSVTPQ